MPRIEMGHLYRYCRAFLRAHKIQMALFFARAQAGIIFSS